ncbi:MAG: CRISPR-associated endonuclease Cas1 [Deltaproteobacteria bacterium]
MVLESTLLILERMFSHNEIVQAWQYIKNRGSSGGIDNVSIEEYSNFENDNCNALTQSLNSKTYIPSPFIQIEINKDNNEKREIGMSTITDKIVQQAIRNRIEPKLEKVFQNTSYAYRPEKGALKAIHRVNHIIKHEKLGYVVKCDIDNYFDTISHDKLKSFLHPLVKEEYILELIMMFCKMGYLKNKVLWKDRNIGVPQGGILSPLLSNLFLTPLDQRMHDRKISYVRYADDFVFFTSDKESGENHLLETINYIERKLSLKLNAGTVVQSVNQGFKFLGIWITNEGNFLLPEKIETLKKRISESLDYQNSVSKFHEVIDGIRAYYGQLIPSQIMHPIDEFIKNLWFERLKEKKIKTIKVIRKELNAIRFITVEFQKNNRSICDILAKQIYTATLKPKIEKAEDAVNIRKREYEKKSQKYSHLVISGYGKSIGFSKNQITIKEYGRLIQAVPAHNLKQISISSPASNISTALIFHTAINNIPIDIINNKGEPIAKIFSAGFEDTALWQLQHEHVQNQDTHQIAISIVKSKIKNQLKLIKYFSKYASKTDDELKEKLPDTLKSLKDIISSLYLPLVEDWRNQLMGYEGAASMIYWTIIQKMIEEETDFKGRIRHGANDLVNCMLNYGYSILYHHVWTSIIKNGLNPGFSYLHKPEPKTGTLIFDLIESFRQPVVDRAIISLINRGSTLEIKNGLLTQKTIELVIKAIDDRLNRSDIYCKQKSSLFNIIDRQTAELIKSINEPEYNFKPYEISKW